MPKNQEHEFDDREDEDIEQDEGFEDEDDIDDEDDEEVDWKQRALNAEQRLEARRKNKEKRKPFVKPKSSEQDSSIEARRIERLELRQEGYSDETIKEILRFGGVKALKNPRSKAYFDSLESQVKAEENVISTETGKSEIEKKHTPEEISRMSADELYKIAPKGKKS